MWRKLFTEVSSTLYTHAPTHPHTHLDTVEDGAHDTGAELDRQRLSTPEDGVADSQPGRVFVNLMPRQG